jgi:hypothetical protein
MLSDHVWIHRANKILECQPHFGERIRLTAMVVQYKNKEGLVKYNLDSPSDIEFPDRNGIAIRIPETKTETPKVETPKLTKIEESKCESYDSLALVFKLKSLADEVGGLERVEQAIASLKKLRE